MIPVRFAPLLFAVLMSIYMVTLMTLVITWVNTGLGKGFLGRWWRAFYIAWPVAFALILIGAPRLQRLVGKLVRRPES